MGGGRRSPVYVSVDYRDEARCGTNRRKILASECAVELPEGRAGEQAGPPPCDTMHCFPLTIDVFKGSNKRAEPRGGIFIPVSLT
jgi:hypothetical protein